VRESISLDYKQDLPGSSNEEKKEFLRDVISLANSSGGDLVYGVAERRGDDGTSTGEAERITGVRVDNPDGLVLRLENMLRTSIAPRLPGCTFKFVEVPDGNAVLVLRVPQSLAAPHMLTLQTRSPFYARNNGGKFEMDVYQIRDAFLQAYASTERFSNFRDERIQRVADGTTPVPLVEGPKIVLHTMPLSGLRAPQQVDPIFASRQLDHLFPLGAYGADMRYNFDGVLMFAQLRPGSDLTSTSYTQAFRNGFMEFVSAHHSDNNKVIWADALEQEALAAVRNHLRFFEAVEVSLPAYVTLSLVNVDGCELREPSNNVYHFTRPTRLQSMDQAQLLLPEVLIEDVDQPLERILKPVFDMVWQAAGIAGSPYYDTKGNRVVRR
jgi:hypothetical protein